MSLQISTETSSKKDYLICSDKINGFGDLICGLRFAKMLSDIGVPFENIIIATNNLENMQALNGDRFKVIHFSEISKIEKLLKNNPWD